MEDISFEFLRRQNLLLDFTIVAGDGEFRAHSQLLAARSGYFRDFICNPNKELNKVNIHRVDCIGSDRMEEILDFIYTGKIELSSVKAPQYLEAASFLRIPRLKEVCLSFITKGIYNPNGNHNSAAIDGSNCLALLELAVHERVQGLDDAALLQCGVNFEAIVDTDHFERINLEVLERIVADDRLVVLDEKDVLDAVIKWVNADKRNRTSCLDKLLPLVRFALFEPSSLEDVSQKDFIRGSVTYSRLVGRAREFQACKQLEHDLNITPRGGPYLYFIIDPPTTSQQTHYCRYDFTSKRTAIICVMNNPSGFAVAAHGQMLYLIGSSSRLNGDTIMMQRFNTISCELHAGPNFRCHRRDAQVVSDGEHIYVIGGRADRITMNIVDRYSIQQCLWTEVKPLPASRCGHAALLHNGFIYVVGGSESELGYSTDVMRYQIETDTWMHHSNTLTARTNTSLCVCRNKLYAIGSSSKPYTSAEVYDEKEGRWVQIQSLQSIPKLEMYGKVYYTSVEYNGRIYAFSSTHLECYDPDTGCWSVEDFNFPFEFENIKYLKMQPATDKHRRPLTYVLPKNKRLKAHWESQRITHYPGPPYPGPPHPGPPYPGSPDCPWL